MKLKYLGTAAAEGIPAIFCECEVCRRSRAARGRNIRTRSQAIVDDTLLIDFPADTYMHFLLHNVPLNKIKSCIITHSHSDHLYENDILMRREGFSHIKDIQPLTFFADVSAHDKIGEFIKTAGVGEKFAKNTLIEPFVPFETEGYRITPLRASHDEKSSPVIFLIEKNGKTLFYSNDTGVYLPETWDYLKGFGKKIDLVSLDCTNVTLHTNGVGHMGIDENKTVRERLRDFGVADENTIFVLNHFSHNCEDAMYDDFVRIAEREDFVVSYDGMEIEF